MLRRGSIAHWAVGMLEGKRRVLMRFDIHRRSPRSLPYRTHGRWLRIEGIDQGVRAGKEQGGWLEYNLM